MFRSAGYDDLQEYYKDNEAVLMESLSALPFSYRKLETIFEIQKNSNISLTELYVSL